MNIDMPDESAKHTVALLLERQEQLQHSVRYERGILEETDRSRVRSVQRLQEHEEQLLFIEEALASMGYVSKEGDDGQ